MKLHAVLLLAISLGCGDSSGPVDSLPITNAANLAAQLDSLDQAFGSPQLKGLGALALPLLSAGVNVHTMDSSMLGRTMEWDAIHEQLQFTARACAPSNALKATLYALGSNGLPTSAHAEIGYAYLVPSNQFTGARSDSTALRVVVFNHTTPAGGGAALKGGHNPPEFKRAASPPPRRVPGPAWIPR